MFTYICHLQKIFASPQNFCLCFSYVWVALGEQGGHERGAINFYPSILPNIGLTMMFNHTQACNILNSLGTSAAEVKSRRWDLKTCAEPSSFLLSKMPCGAFFFFFFFFNIYIYISLPLATNLIFKMPPKLAPIPSFD